MSYWADLQQAIQSTIISGRIGTPVFGRATLVLAETPVNQSQFVAGLVCEISRWFSAQPCRIYAQRSPKAAHLSLNVEYSTGAMLLLSLVFGQAPAHLDLALIGNVGAAYHRESLTLPGQPFMTITLTEEVWKLQPAIETALGTGDPVSVKMEGEA